MSQWYQLIIQCYHAVLSWIDSVVCYPEVLSTYHRVLKCYLGVLLLCVKVLSRSVILNPGVLSRSVIQECYPGVLSRSVIQECYRVVFLYHEARFLIMRDWECLLFAVQLNHIHYYLSFIPKASQFVHAYIRVFLPSVSRLDIYFL